MKQWLRKVPRLSQFEIYDAVHNTDWQILRLKLKGLSTEEKLNQLRDYIDFDTEGLSLQELKRREIRVANYINALKRGGLLNADLEVIK